MNNVLLVIHLLITLALIGVVLLQKSEGGALGMGGGSGGGAGGMGGFLSGRGKANLLTRTTAVLAAGFIATSMALTMLADTGGERRSIAEEITAPAADTESEQPIAPPVSE